MPCVMITPFRASQRSSVVSCGWNTRMKTMNLSKESCWIVEPELKANVARTGQSQHIQKKRGNIKKHTPARDHQPRPRPSRPTTQANAQKFFARPKRARKDKEGLQSQSRLCQCRGDRLRFSKASPLLFFAHRHHQRRHLSLHSCVDVT